jgi:hypothetical protein
VQELEQQAGVLVGDGAHAQPSLTFRTADTLPSDKALGTSDFIGGSPEEGAVESVEGGEHSRRV